MSDSYVCSGCQKKYKHSGDYIQHLEHTQKPACKAAHDALKQTIRHSHFMPRCDPPSAHFTSPQSRSSRDPTDVHSNNLDDPGVQFEGDFFGNDYSAEDFPGFEREDERWNDDGENCRDEAGHDREAVEDGGMALEMEPTFERPREQVTVPAKDSENPNAMQVDDGDPPPSPKNPLLCDLPAHRESIHVVEFGGQAGEPVESPNSSSTFYDSTDGFQHYESRIPGINSNPYTPFASQMDWEVARWAKLQGTGSTAFSDLLAIDGVSEALGLSYRSSDDLNKIIDKEIPAQRPSFVRKEVVIAGEAFDIYQRPIIDCLRALYGSPEHSRYMCFAPERHYADADMTQRLYHDMNTGKWWWSTQKELEQKEPGATIIPVILSSDKTQITLFRNKSAYPVYLTIRNLPKEIRRKPSKQGQILLAYLPTTRLEHINNKASRRRSIANLFYASMNSVLSPLKEAGSKGIVLESRDGVKRRCHPILAVYVGDYPEQMLVTCGYYGDCPVCMAEKLDLGGYPCNTAYHDPKQAVKAAKSIGKEGWAQKCLDANIKPMQHPFWEDLPYTDIFHSITPDLLHQMYQGVMKHLIGWITHIVGDDEVDAQVRHLPAKHGIRHFHKGITTLSRVSGAEHKQICTFLLGLVLDVPSLSATQSRSLITATRSLLDFLYMASYPIHSDVSLTLLEATLETFHNNKAVFVELGAREHFNLPKLHSLSHYVRAIKLYGTCDNYNTETTERLHIDFAKDAYRATNRKDEYSQNTKWLERREKVIHHTNYLAWKRSQPPPPSTSEPSNVTPAPSSVNAGVRYNVAGSLRSLTNMKCPLMPKLAKFPTRKTVSFDKLGDPTSMGGHGATQLEYALKEFIARFRDPGLSAGEVEDMAHFLSLSFRNVPVWHKIKFQNPELYGDETLDVVSAHPRRFSSRGQVTQVSCFDAALVQTQQKNDDGDFLQGLQIGRVRVIFSIPQNHLHRLFPPNTTPPTHLTYIEWFTKFPRNPESGSRLLRIKPLMRRDESRAVSVVPVEMISQSVHLYPKWGGAVPPDWT
ncbi:hypothetical protein V5O48_018380, partial [Marasmius crinis-equi]